MIKAGIGTEVIEIDYGGWDTHNGQGGANGAYANQLRALIEAIAAFHQDMGSAMKDTLVVTLSDFGRTVRENGTNGTDHGWANCMLMFGGAVKREDKVLGEWPGLAPEQLYQDRDTTSHAPTSAMSSVGELVSNIWVIEPADRPAGSPVQAGGGGGIILRPCHLHGLVPLLFRRVTAFD